MLPLSLFLLVVASCFGRALGHYSFSSLIINGEVTEPWRYVRNHTNGVYPIKATDVASLDMRCNVGAALGNKTSTVSVAAGSLVGFTVDPAIFHSGVANVYMARVPSGYNAKTFNGAGKVWFKIFEIPPEWDSQGNITFPTTNMSDISFLLPKSIPNGDYLLRVEHLALHLALNLGQAEFYVGCAQVTVTGGGSTLPTNTVAIPGAYQQTDPGIYINIYSPMPTSYAMPGPTISVS